METRPSPGVPDYQLASIGEGNAIRPDEQIIKDSVPVAYRHLWLIHRVNNTVHSLVCYCVTSQPPTHTGG